MQYPYQFNELVPVSTSIDDDGDVHAIYNLPAPKGWIFHRYIEGIEVSESVHSVTKVRICILANEFSIPTAVVVPFDEQGQEVPLNSLHFDETASVIGIMYRMGYAPILSMN